MTELPINVLRESKAWIFSFLALCIVALFLNLGLFFRSVLARVSRPCESVRCTLYVTHMLLAVTGSLAVFLSLMHTPAAAWMCLLADFLGGLGYQASVGCLLVMSVLSFMKKYTERTRGDATDPQETQQHHQGLIQPNPASRSVTRELAALVSVWVVSAVTAALHVAPLFRRGPLRNQTRTCHSLSLLSEHGGGWEYVFALYVCVDGGLLVASLVLGVVSKCQTRHAMPAELLTVTLICCLLWTPCLYFGYLSFAPVPPWMAEHGMWVELAVLLSPALLSPLVSLAAEMSRACRSSRNESTGRTGTREVAMERTRVESVYRRMESQKVSMPLSEYLASGNPLSPQEAIVLVSSLSQSITSLHKLGMSPGAIDPDNVMLDCDLDGSIMKSHLMGMPVQPPDIGAQMEKDKEAIGRLFNQMMQHSKLHAPRDTSRTTSMKITSRKSLRAKEETRENGEGLQGLRGRSLYSNVRKSYHHRKRGLSQRSRESSSHNHHHRSPSRSRKSRMMSTRRDSTSAATNSRPQMARSQSEMLSIRVSRLSVRTMRSSLHSENPRPPKTRKLPSTKTTTTRRSKWFDNPAFQGSVEGPESPFSPDTDSTYVSEAVTTSSESQATTTFRAPGLGLLRRHILHESLDEGDEENNADNESLIARFSRRWKRKGKGSSSKGRGRVLEEGVVNPVAMSVPVTPSCGDDGLGTQAQRTRPSTSRLSLNIPDTARY